MMQSFSACKIDLFSVPRQERIDHGELIRWTKGFGAGNTEGRDVAEMFKRSLEKYVCSPYLKFLLILTRARSAIAHQTDRSHQ
jgi:hexokinase